MRVKSFILNGKDDNKTNVDIILDFCSLVEHSDHPILKSFLPNIDVNMQAILHACPYSVYNEWKNVVANK
jgi:hypothetical protein